MSRRKELGDIVAIELPNSKKAYGRVYKEYTIGIYNGFYDSVDALTGRGSLYHHGEIYPCTYEEWKENIIMELPIPTHLQPSSLSG